MTTRTEETSQIAVIGLGYVGLPLAHSFSMAGIRVIGFDVDQGKISKLDRGEPYLDHVNLGLFEDLARSDRFEATSDMQRLSECDTVLVAVPTPLGRHNEPDLSYVLETAETIATHGRDGQLVVLESTTFPGTTRDEFAPIIAGSHPNSLFAYSPEREDPGRALATSEVPKLVGGITPEATKLAASVYRTSIAQVVEVESAEIAEAAKILENVFRAVNIAMVNELKTILDKMGIDIWQVIDAAATKPFGFMRFTPGPGLGGHCIPIDPFYLTWKAKEYGVSTQFIELSGIVNRSMPAFVVSKVIAALNDIGKAASTSRILIVGLAYKPNVGDIRESPSLELIAQLESLGADVEYHDPFVPSTWPMRRYQFEKQSVDLNSETVGSFDVVVIATDHTDLDYQAIADHAAIVVDTRNAMKSLNCAGRLVKA